VRSLVVVYALLCLRLSIYEYSTLYLERRNVKLTTPYNNIVVVVDVIYFFGIHLFLGHLGHLGMAFVSVINLSFQKI
jgi:hypothetical protein